MNSIFVLDALWGNVYIFDAEKKTSKTFDDASLIITVIVHEKHTNTRDSLIKQHARDRPSYRSYRSVNNWSNKTVFYAGKLQM